MRKYSILFFLVVLVKSYSQQKIGFSFAESPQTLLLNPGAETNYKYHYGVPMLNNFQFDAGSTSYTLNDLFNDNGIGFTDKLKTVLEDSNASDFLNINLRSDLLYGGFRYDDRTYFSFGFYQEVDFIFYTPKDLLELGLFGNANSLNRNYQFSQLNFKGDLQGVLHFGVSRKINKQLNVGARVKIYSSSANLETSNNGGTLTTFNTSENVVRQTLNNVNINLRSSGFFNSNDNFLQTPLDLYTNTFLGGNYGLGFDLGFTYHLTPQIEITASALDIGFIRYSKDIRNYTAEGDFVFDGVNFQFDEDNPVDYWDELQNEFDDRVQIDENQEAYTSFRPLKLNAALRYSFGDVRPMQCFTPTRKSYYSNAIGFQLHSIIRPLVSQLALTSFFETSFSDNFHIKLTHTFNNYSNTVFGGALAFQWRTFNFFTAIDNITKARNLETANHFALNLGVNFVIR